MSKKKRNWIDDAMLASLLYGSKVPKPDEGSPIQDVLKQLGLEGVGSQEIAKPASPSEPRAAHWGFWKGDEGAWLKFDGVSSESHPDFVNSSAHFGRRPTIEITGTAIDQQVHGYGVRTGDNVKIYLLLVATQRWVDLDLNMNHRRDGTSTWINLKGTAQNPDGEMIPVSLRQVAADLTGTYSAEGGTSLSFSEGSLEWDKNQRQVRGKAWGAVFGRYGEGEFEFHDDQYLEWVRLSVDLESKDTSHFRRWLEQNGKRNWKYMQQWELDFDYREPYQQSCPQEAWWGADTLLLHLDVGVDHRTLDGTVVAIGHKYKREAPVHLTYRPTPKTERTKSLL
jgi:hypothetical protein